MVDIGTIFTQWQSIGIYEYLLPISTNDEFENGQCFPTILTNSLFDFIGHINKRPDRNNQNRYITVHCEYKNF